MYAQRVASLLLDAIQLDETKGETPLLPRLNRYKPIASTASVHFKTVKPVQAAGRSHINYV
jgi:type III restriction enzyme